MKILFAVVILLLLLIDILVAQQKELLINIKNQYQTFEYQNVVNLSNELLKKTDSLSNEELIELYLMKGVSHYALAEEPQTRISFVNILKIKKEAELDSDKVSPKILLLFKEVKEEFFQSIKPINEKELINRNSEILGFEMVNKLKNDTKYSFAKSIILPGWGQLSREEKTKGWILLALSSASLSAMFYYIFDTNNKEKLYLSENNTNEIKIKYDSYNTSFKIRNILISSYVFIWLYSQIDFLFLGEDEINKNLLNVSQFKFYHDSGFNFIINIPF